MKNKNLIISATVCALSLILLITVIAVKFGKPGEAEEEVYIAPKFEENVKTGMPDTDDESFTYLSKEGMPYSAHICGKVTASEGEAKVLFTNDKGNKAWLKLRILDEKGEILGESGLLKPDEYVETVKIKDGIPDNTKIKMKIMGYEPETYYSVGSVELNTILTVE